MSRREPGWRQKVTCRRSSMAGQIASVANVNGLILVTRNASDFDRFSGVEIENWHEE